MSVEETRPYVFERIFWDVTIDDLDYDQHQKFIITRVFERGDVEDIRACRRYYSNREILTVLLNAAYLSPIKLSLASAIIDRPKEDFRCYSKKQSIQTHYPL